MEWLTDNLIANMYGPTFLAFYLLVILVTIVSCWLARRGLDWTGRMPSPVVPFAPDPHETAYLRGGENEVARSVIFTLIQKNLLSLEQAGTDYAIGPTRETAERRALSPIERRALDWFAEPQATSKIFKADGLAAQLRPFCAAYEHRLRQERFLPTVEMTQRARLIRFVGAFVIVALGSYKLLVALSRGRSNVLFLVALGALGMVAIFLVTRLPKQTKRGRDYLERLRTAFERLRIDSRTTTETVSLGLANAGARISNPTSAYGLDPALPLLVGVFGVGALAGTEYDLFHQTFRRSAVSDGGAWAGASCGSCSSSSSDGGGGSGSGGGSCGGSCGGGCGGCGG